MNTEATNLYDQHDKMWLAKRVVELEVKEANLRDAIEEKCKDLDFEAQELLLTGKEDDLNRASAYHYAIDHIRGGMG